MKIFLGVPRGFCAGVVRAIDLVEIALKKYGTPVYVKHQIVHNPHVVLDLEKKGAITVEEVEEIPRGSRVVFSAHGSPPSDFQKAKERDLKVVDATCPLVHFAHKQVRELVRAGYHPVIIGRHGHVEVRGLSEDLTQCDVVLSETDIDLLEFQPRFGVVAQTTQPIARVRELVEYLQARFPDSEVRFVDTVCQPTKQRQSAAEELARKSDVVLVVGGANSNNTRELVRTCAKYCERVHHVQGPDDLQIEWLMGTNTAGITRSSSRRLPSMTLPVRSTTLET